jgi:hypothetical protein
VLLDLANVRVPVDDGSATRKPAHEARLAPLARAWDVDHADANAVHLDDVPLRECLAQRRLVHVPVDGFDRPEGAQLVQHGRCDDVAEMEDQVGCFTAANALVRQPACAPGQMRVRDDRNDSQSSSRNEPSR